MKTETHFELAIRLCDRCFPSATVPQKTAFVNGNVMPDINPFSYLRGFKVHPFFGHDWQNANTFILSAAEKLTVGHLGYFGLGVFMHYLCDAFTYTHNRGFHGSLSEHTAYEKRLHTFVLQGGNRFDFKISNCSLSDFITRSHKVYEQAKPSFATDAAYILSAVEVVAAVFKLNQKLPLGAEALDGPRCVERYISRP